MATETKIVLDANILIRAVLGQKVRNNIEKFANSAQFFTPDICFADARKYLPALFAKRNFWTENADFFGSGVATWTSDRVHLYLSKGDRKISNDDK